LVLTALGAIEGFRLNPNTYVPRVRTEMTSGPMAREEFVRQFPDGDACLRYLKERFYPDGSRCPRCARPSKFHRLRGRHAYSCQFCGTHVYPTAGTIFHRSTTDLQLWFWTIYLIGSTGGGISVRELERELGVSYNTAARMLRRLRPLLVGMDTDSQREVEPEASSEPVRPPGPRPAWQGRRRHATPRSG
jgi:transposase-like protein